MESVSTSCLIDLAFDLSVDWRKLARALDLANEVQRIDEDYRKNVFEQAYRMLQKWKGRNGARATYQALGEALKTQELTRNDLAQKYCEGGNRGSLETEIDLEGHLKSGQVSVKGDMISIANDLGKDWMWVGRLLGLEDAALDNIQKNAHPEMYEYSYNMLLLWFNSQGAQATYECLARALLHRTVGMRDVAEKYCLEPPESQTASSVPPEEGIQPLNEKMEHLQLSGLSKESGVAAGSPVNTDAETVNRSETDPPRLTSQQQLRQTNELQGISDEQKRWLVIGIAMTKVTAPVLRDFVNQGMDTRYANNTYCSGLTAPCTLKTLTYRQVNPDPNLRRLKFQNINNNLHLHGNRKNLYNYSVNSSVDLAKLFLPDYLAKFSAFDESLDMSAILRLLRFHNPAPIFPSPNPLMSIQTSADDVSENVRNKWGHCNFTEWTEVLFNDCFSKLETLVRSLGLTGGIEKTILDQLSDWKTKGYQLSMGHAVDQNLLSLVQQDTKELIEKYRRTEKEQSAIQGSLDQQRTEQMEMQNTVASFQDEKSSTRFHLEEHDKQLEAVMEWKEQLMKENKGILETLGELLNRVQDVEKGLARPYNKVEQLEKDVCETRDKVKQLEEEFRSQRMKENEPGCQLSMGHAVDQNLLSLVQQDVKELVENVNKIESEQSVIQESLDQQRTEQIEMQNTVASLQDQQSSTRVHLEEHDKQLEAVMGCNEKLMKENKGILETLVSVEKTLSKELIRVEDVEKGSTSPVPDDCIIKNFITILPYKVWRELIIRLDPERPLQGDYRDLASEMGFTVLEILSFQSLKNPTEAVLTSCAGWASLEDLCNKLEAIGRRDARLLIDEWVKTQDCKCAVCNN